MALNSFSTSVPIWLIPAVLSLLAALVEPGAGALCSAVSAVCAAEMFPLESADDTLARNLPIGLLESAFAGLSCFISARYFCASLVSPDLMEDIRPLSAVAKAFWLLPEVEEADDVEEVEEAARSENNELVFCKLEICMGRRVLSLSFRGGRNPALAARVTSVDRKSVRKEYTSALDAKKPIPFRNRL